MSAVPKNLKSTLDKNDESVEFLGSHMGMTFRPKKPNDIVRHCWVHMGSRLSPAIARQGRSVNNLTPKTEKTTECSECEPCLTSTAAVKCRLIQQPTVPIHDVSRQRKEILSERKRSVHEISVPVSMANEILLRESNRSTDVVTDPDPPVRRHSGRLFQGLKEIPTMHSIDPPPDACYNCWQTGHKHHSCPTPVRALFCYNCGRRGVTMTTCPRCRDAYFTIASTSMRSIVPLIAMSSPTTAIDPSSSTPENMAGSSSVGSLSTVSRRRRRRRYHAHAIYKGSSARNPTTKRTREETQGPYGKIKKGAASTEAKKTMTLKRSGEDHRNNHQLSETRSKWTVPVSEQGDPLKIKEPVTEVSVVKVEVSDPEDVTNSTMDAPRQTTPSRKSVVLQQWMQLVESLASYSPETKQKVLTVVAAQARRELTEE